MTYNLWPRREDQWPEPGTKVVKEGSKYGLQATEWTFKGNRIEIVPAGPDQEGVGRDEFLPETKWVLEPIYDQIEKVPMSSATEPCRHDLWRVSLGTYSGLYHADYMNGRVILHGIWSDYSKTSNDADFTGAIFECCNHDTGSPYSYLNNALVFKAGFVLEPRCSNLQLLELKDNSPCHVVADGRHGVLDYNGRWWVKPLYDDAAILDPKLIIARTGQTYEICRLLEASHGGNRLGVLRKTRRLRRASRLAISWQGRITRELQAFVNRQLT